MRVSAPSSLDCVVSLSVLRLTPTRTPQTIFSVISDCGDNIDAAIKRLGQLRLSAEGKAGSTPGSAEDAGAN
jgi:hypothetical protein